MHKMSQNIDLIIFLYKLKMQQEVTERFPSRDRQAYKFSALWWVQAWYISSCKGISELEQRLFPGLVGWEWWCAVAAQPRGKPPSALQSSGAEPWCVVGVNLHGFIKTKPHLKWKSISTLHHFNPLIDLISFSSVCLLRQNICYKFIAPLPSPLFCFIIQRLLFKC